MAEDNLVTLFLYSADNNDRNVSKQALEATIAKLKKHQYIYIYIFKFSLTFQKGTFKARKTKKIEFFLYFGMKISSPKLKNFFGFF